MHEIIWKSGLKKQFCKPINKFLLYHMFPCKNVLHSLCIESLEKDHFQRWSHLSTVGVYGLLRHSHLITVSHRLRLSAWYHYIITVIKDKHSWYKDDYCVYYSKFILILSHWLAMFYVSLGIGHFKMPDIWKANPGWCDRITAAHFVRHPLVLKTCFLLRNYLKSL